MISDDPARPTIPARQSGAPGAGGQRYSLLVVIGAAVVGMVIGALCVFAITGLVWTVRVELPPPPYPQVSSLLPTPASVSAPSAPPTPASGGMRTPPPLPPPPG